MLADLSDALARLAFSRLAADRAHPRADLDALPPLLAHTLRQRLDREVSTRLGAAASWVSPVPDLWREDADVEARYPASAWAPSVREASEWLLAALVHPADALAEAAPETGQRSTGEVLDRMSDLGAYPYLGEIVGRYAQKKELEGYDRATLHGLLDRVDRRIAVELDAVGWQALLGPLYDVVGALPEFPDGVPGRVLAEVFAARGRPGLGATVVSHETVSREALAEVLAEALAPEPEEPEASAPPPEPPEVVVVEPRASSQSPPDESISDAVEVEHADQPEAAEAPLPEPEIAQDDRPFEAAMEETGSEPADPEPDDDPQGAITDAEPPPVLVEEPDESAQAQAPPEADDEPLWARLARQSGGTPDALAPPPEEAVEPLWRRFAADDGAASSPSEHAATPPASGHAPEAGEAEDVEARVLGPHADQRAVYVDQLFGGDEAAYHRVLGLLDDAASWSESTEIIGREVFRRYQTPIYSEPAASFTDAVEQRFSRG